MLKQSAVPTFHRPIKNSKKDRLTKSPMPCYPGFAYKTKTGGHSSDGIFCFKTNKNKYSVERPVCGKPATLEACFGPDAALHAFLFLEVI